MTAHNKKEIGLLIIVVLKGECPPELSPAAKLTPSGPSQLSTFPIAKPGRIHSAQLASQTLGMQRPKLTLVEGSIQVSTPSEHSAQLGILRELTVCCRLTVWDEEFRLPVYDVPGQVQKLKVRLSALVLLRRCGGERVVQRG